MLLPRRRQGYIIDVRFTLLQRIEGPHSSGDTIPSIPAKSRITAMGAVLFECYTKHMQKLNKLELRIEKSKYNIGEIVNIYIDGRNLIDIVEEFEKQFIQEGETASPGGYGGSDPVQFMIEMQYDYAKDVAVLVEPVEMISGNWDLLMDYDTQKDEVIWYGFHQEHRKDWDYSDFPTFTFNKSDCRQEIDSLIEHCAKQTNDTVEKFRHHLKTVADRQSEHPDEAGFYLNDSSRD